MEYRGTALYESLVLCEFFEDAFPDHKPHLLPSDPVARAQVRIWVDHVSKAFVPAFHRLLQSQEKDKQDAARQELYEATRTLMEKVKGPYFLGEEFSLADVSIAPFILRDYVLAEHRDYKRSEVNEAWVKYAGIVENRDTVVRTMSVSLCMFPLNPTLSPHVSNRRNGNISMRFMDATCVMRHRVKQQRPQGLGELFRRPRHLETHATLGNHRSRRFDGR